MAHVSFPSTLRAAVVFLSVCVLLAAAVAPAVSQVVDLPGGSSVAFQPKAASMHLAVTGYDASVGVGLLDGRLQVGATVRKRFPGFVLSVGDETVPVMFSADAFDTGQVFVGRGVGVGVTQGSTTAFGFAGTIAKVDATPSHRDAREDETVGALFVRRTLTPQVTLVSDVLVAETQTLLSGLQWRPRDRVRAAVIAGLGANRPYLSSSLAAEGSWVSVKAAYVQRGSEFHRFNELRSLAPPAGQQRVLVTFKPTTNLNVTAGRERRVASNGHSEVGLLRAVNHYATALSHGAFRISGGIFESGFSGEGGVARTAAAGWVCGRLQMAVAVYDDGTRSRTPEPSWVRQIMMRPLEVLEVTNRSEQPSSLLIGGELRTKRGTIQIDYRTMFASRAAADGAFTRALAVNVRVHPFGH